MGLRTAAVTKFVRFQAGDGAAYGYLDGNRVRELRGDLFGSLDETGKEHDAANVKLLAPCRPAKIFAVGLNYRSHLRGRPEPGHPEIFYKPVSALIGPEECIRIPRDANNVHYEGELVAVIGRRTKNVSREEAAGAIFGVTCGNDVSDRDWQSGEKKDLQWWRAKGSDTFAPLGPAIVTGLDYGNLKLQTRLNGEVVQEQTTSDLIFSLPTIVSWISGWVTLEPGDLIYTGTPGATRKLSPGDVVEIEIEGIGVLRNGVSA